MTIVQILAIDLSTGMLPALGLGAERPAPQCMRRPPRPRSERLLSGALLARAYLFLGACEAVAGMSLFCLVLAWGGWSYGTSLVPLDPFYRQATGACLATIVVMQVANVIVCRSPTDSLLWGIAVELALILAILYTPPGQTLFATAALPAAAWLAMLPFAVGLLVLEEARKWLVRHRCLPHAGAAP